MCVCQNGDGKYMDQPQNDIPPRFSPWSDRRLLRFQCPFQNRHPEKNIISQRHLLAHYYTIEQGYMLYIWISFMQFPFFSFHFLFSLLNLHFY